MKIFKYICAAIILCSSSSLSAQQVAEQTVTSTTAPNTQQLQSAYISDDLFVYILAGPGKNFRILGSVSAGEEIKLTGLTDNGYQQLIDGKNRTAWLETKYINNSAGLRAIIAELNGQVASQEEKYNTLVAEHELAKTDLQKLTKQHQKLNSELVLSNNNLSISQQKLSEQDTDLKKEWFYNGAIVLTFGLLVGILITRLPVRRKPSMESWK